MSEQTVETEERVAIDVSDHVATVTLIRPDKHNALDIAMCERSSCTARARASAPGSTSPA